MLILSFSDLFFSGPEEKSLSRLRALRSVSSAYGYCLKNEYKIGFRGSSLTGLRVSVGFGFAKREREFERKTQSELGFPIGVPSFKSETRMRFEQDSNKIRTRFE